jgi:hypothetical protein
MSATDSASNGSVRIHLVALSVGLHLGKDIFATHLSWHICQVPLSLATKLVELAYRSIGILSSCLAVAKIVVVAVKL